MLEAEIHALRHSPDAGVALNQIVDQFLRGRDVFEILSLLDSTDADVVSLGAWILGELPTDRYDVSFINTRLRTLCEHENAHVRLSAFGALFPLLNSEDVSARALLTKLLDDPNPGVRLAAESAGAQWRRG